LEGGGGGGCQIWDHVKWVPCQRSMAHPPVADEGDALQIWRVVANILNKQLQAADRGWSSSLGVGRGLTIPHRKTSLIPYETETRVSDQDGFSGTT
jgi:hypothetical protein